jgi:hypothetical protein
MLPSEKAEFGMALEALERPKAKERQGSHGAAPGRRANTSEKLSEVSRRGETRHIVGAAVGMSRNTYARAKAIAFRREQCGGRGNY